MKIALFGRDMTDADNLVRLKVLLDTLHDKKADLCYFEAFYRSLVGNKSLKIPAGSFFTSAQDLPDDTNLFLSLGGDGTFLSSLSFVRDRGIPLAGINFGRLGFLTTAKVGKDAPGWIDDLLNSNYSIQERFLLKIETSSIPHDFYPYAVNEVSIQRKDSLMLSIDVVIDSLALPTYWADGLVISTPTGSTAYSLSVGGPIVMPDSKVMIIAPIAPHNLNVRPLVVPVDSMLEIVVHSRREDAAVTIDNRTFTIPSKEKIVITKGEYCFKYVSLFDNNFIAALKNKLLWGEDKRNDLTL